MILRRKKMLFRVEGRLICVRNFGQQEGAVYLRHKKKKEAGEEAAAQKQWG